MMKDLLAKDGIEGCLRKRKPQCVTQQQTDGRSILPVAQMPLRFEKASL